MNATILIMETLQKDSANFGKPRNLLGPMRPDFLSLSMRRFFQNQGYSLGVAIRSSVAFLGAILGSLEIWKPPRSYKLALLILNLNPKSRTLYPKP